MFLALPPCQNCENSGLNFADGRRHGHADRLEHFAAYALYFAANGQLNVFFLDVGFLQRLEVLFDVRPFEDMGGFFQMTLEFLAKDQGKEAAEDMPADRIVPLMENGTGSLGG